MKFSALFGLLLAIGITGTGYGAHFEIQRKDGAVAIKIDGQLFTRYVLESNEGGQPYFWPLNGPGGEPMSRGFPMENSGKESTDHPHHRSMFFGHQAIGGVNFWHEPRTPGKPGVLGHSKTIEVVAAEAHQDHAVLRTRTSYSDPSGEVILTDERRFVFHEDSVRHARLIDVEITFIGSSPSVTLGDIKDAGLSIRVADSMTAKAGGRIINSSSDEGEAAAYGKRVPWCDFNGLIGGRVVGIAMLQHPESWGYPTPWHVRSYGLMTSNPFGLKSVSKEKHSGELTLTQGERATIKYRVILHEGDEKQADIEGSYREYSSKKNI